MIYFDGMIFRVSPHGGVSRIFKELWKRWDMVDTGGTVFIPHTVELPRHERLARINFSGRRPRRLYWRFEMSRAYHRTKPEIFLSTFYTLSPDNASKQIAIFYDMIDEIFYDSSWSDHALVSRKKKLAQEAIGIIAISQNTKKDLLSVYTDVPESRITVIPLAAADIFKPRPEDDIAPKIFPGPFILFVGHRRNYKNFMTLLEAYTGNPKIVHDYALVVIDNQPWQKEEIELIKRTNLQGKIHLMQHVPDQALVRYYQQARVFVFPSRYEGFGMPLLESAACGTPVIANSSPGLAQIGGDAVLYFSGPDEVSSLSAQLDKICFDDPLHREYSLKGLEHSARYSWDKFVSQFNGFVNSLV